MLVPVADRSEISGARRAVTEFAVSRGFGESECGRVGLIVTELATNLIKHAEKGTLIVSAFDDAEGSGVEVLALDKGAGIADLARALTDGVSTAGTQGEGLSTIRRQADHFAAFAPSGKGTAVMARVRGPQTAASSNVVIGAVNEPLAGERANGDAWALARDKGPTLFVVDGTGHGAAAAAAAEAAITSFRSGSKQELEQLGYAVHRALASSRGGAIGIARVDEQAQTVRFVGVGNIAAAVVDGQGTTKRMVSNHGTAGHIAPRIREFTYPHSPGSTVVLHSDGLSAKWDLSDYPGLASSHPSLIAGILFRDYSRGRDDATVVAMRVGR